MNDDRVVLRVLLVDDDEDDYIITSDIFSDIEGTEFDIDWISNYDDALEQIATNQHDVYFFDYRLGEHTGLELLQEAINNGCKEPMILLTGQGDRQVDMEAMRIGATDYLVKGRIDQETLDRVIRYSVERKRSEKERDKLISDLQEAIEKINTLGGLLPICSSCKRIRDDKGYWNLLEAYLTDHSDAELSHSICPPCMTQLYPGVKAVSDKSQPTEKQNEHDHAESEILIEMIESVNKQSET